MKSYRIVFVVLVSLMLVNISTLSYAGFLDGFNKISQTVQQTTNTIENANRSIERAGNVIPKPKKEPAQPAAAKQVQAGGSLSVKDRAAIEKAKRAWVAAFKAEDWDALVDQYAEDATIMPPNEDEKSGHEAIRANFKTDEDTSNEVFETVEINGSDSIAFVQGKFSFMIKSKLVDGPAINASGKYIEIWEKQSEGTWLITHDIWNANIVE